MIMQTQTLQRRRSSLTFESPCDVAAISGGNNIETKLPNPPMILASSSPPPSSTSHQFPHAWLYSLFVFLLLLIFGGSSTSTGQHIFRKNLRGATCVTHEYCSQTNADCDFTKVRLCAEDLDFPNPPPLPSNQTTPLTSGDASSTNLDKPKSTPAKVRKIIHKPIVVKPIAPVTIKSPVTNPPLLRASDLRAWRKLFQYLSGRDWIECSNFDTPCNQGNQCGTSPARDVVCEEIEGELRIVSIRLENNNMHGVFPSRPLAELDALRVLNLANSVYSKPSPNNLDMESCFALARCKSEMVCNLAGIDMSALQYCGEETHGLAVGDLETWRDFYSALGGENWKHCADSKHDPCKCGEARDDGLQFVVCKPVDSVLRITHIHLPDNNLQGIMPDLSKWSELRALDLTSSSETKNVVIGCTSCPHYATCLGVTLCMRTFEDDSRAFIHLRHQLSPPGGWKDCAHSVDPCNDCSDRVKCVLNAGETTLRISELDLANNGMVGELPQNLTLEGGFLHLTSLILSNNRNGEEVIQYKNALTHSSGSCVDYLFCRDPAHLCEARNVGVHFCENTERLTVREKQAWTQFYDRMHGLEWAKGCHVTRDDPCSQPQCVQCKPLLSGGGEMTISKITLANTNVQLVANRLPSLAAFRNLEVLDLSMNTKLISSTAEKCWNVPECGKSIKCNVLGTSLHFCAERSKVEGVMV